MTDNYEKQDLAKVYPSWKEDSQAIIDVDDLRGYNEDIIGKIVEALLEEDECSHEINPTLHCTKCGKRQVTCFDNKGVFSRYIYI